MISSLGKKYNPEISYAPFIMLNDKIYVYLSKAANHYYNLRDNNKCSVMIIEDENLSKIIFVRIRVSFNCEANMMNSVGDEIFSKFDEIHDIKMMSMLRKMDFDMFELKIKSGRLVKGFGQVYDIKFVNGNIECTQVTGIDNQMGHGMLSDNLKEMIERK